MIFRLARVTTWPGTCTRSQRRGRAHNVYYGKYTRARAREGRNGHYFRRGMRLRWPENAIPTRNSVDLCVRPSDGSSVCGATDKREFFFFVFRIVFVRRRCGTGREGVQVYHFSGSVGLVKKLTVFTVVARV